MLGIETIGTYIPKKRISNFDKKEKFDIDDNFIESKIGVLQHAERSEEEETSDLCVSAFGSLKSKITIDINDIDCCIVVTQNPDYNIPHTSAIVHKKLNLKTSCACFDISLGCSGYVYGLSIIKSFMQENGLKKGLLFTSDPYSKVVNSEDKNTALLFGDAATVTLVGEKPIYKVTSSVFGTYGAEYSELVNLENGLYMNGRAIFNFSAKNVPVSVNELLKKVGMTINEVDKLILHQGSKFIVDTIKKRLNLSDDKVPFSIQNYGNTVSSSIPNILETEIENDLNKKIVISGFGVGLSWGSMLLERINKQKG